MNRLYTLLLAGLLIGQSAYADFPTRQNVSTTDMAKVTGNFDSFSWRWAGYESQDVTITVKNGSSFVDMTDYGVGCKISRRTDGSLTTYIDYTTSATNITISSSNLTFSVPYTNIPTDGQCLVELWAWTGAATNNTRTIAQGKIAVFASIYGIDDSSYPFSAATNMTDYVPFTDTRYLAALTNAGQFADSAQGALADTAVQPSTSFSMGTILSFVGSGFTNTITATLTNFTFNVQGTNYYLP